MACMLTDTRLWPWPKVRQMKHKELLNKKARDHCDRLAKVKNNYADLKSDFGIADRSL